MGMHWPKSGANSVAEYQMSGLPFVTSSIAATSSTTWIQFPYVTKFLTIRNTSANYLAIGFTDNGVKGGDRFTLPPSGSLNGEFRVTDVFLRGIVGAATFEAVAGMTMIDRMMFPVLTGSAAPGVAASDSNERAFGYGPNGLG